MALPSLIEFLNVDFEIYAPFDLQPLVSSLGKNMMVLYVGRERSSHTAKFELAGPTKSADSTICKFCALIQGLPKAERHLWNRAERRGFSIGVQAGERPNPCDFAVEAATVKAVAELGARIVLTVYPPRLLSFKWAYMTLTPNRPKASFHYQRTPISSALCALRDC